VSQRRVHRRRLVPALARSHHLARNSLFTILTTAVNSGLGVLYWAIVAHRFSTNSVGLGTALLSAVTLASIFSIFGLGPTLIQILPTAPDDQTWSVRLNAGVAGGGVAGLVIGAVTVVALPLLSGRFGAAEHDPALAFMMVGGTSLFTIFTVFDYVFIAERSTHYTLGRNVVFGLIKLAAVLLPAAAFGSSEGLMLGSWVLAYGVVCAGTAILLIPRLGHVHSWGIRGVTTELRGLGTRLAKNHLVSLGGASIQYLMPVVVVARLSTNDNSYFYVAWLVATMLLVVSPAVAGSMLAEGVRGSTRHVRTGSLLIAALLVPGSLILIVAGRPILRVFGSSYANHSYAVLVLFALIVWPDAATNVYTTVLRVSHQEGFAAIMNVAMAAAALASAWILLPSMGLTGAAWGWLAGEVFGTVLMIGHLVVQRSRSTPEPIRHHDERLAIPTG